MALSSSGSSSRRQRRLINDYVRAALQGDDVSAGRAVERALNELGSARRVYLELIVAAQDRLGELWEKGEIGVADEHIATEITLGQMHRIRRELSQAPAIQHHAVVTALEGEKHSLGGRIFADLLSEEGWSVDFMGAGTPVHSLVDYIHRRSPELVAVTLTGEPSFEQVLNLTSKFDNKARRPKFLIGGRAARMMASSFEGVAVDGIASDIEDGLRLVRAWFTPDRYGGDFDRVLKFCGHVLAERRKAKNLTQGQLAATAGIDRGYISAIEQGRQNVSVSALVKLSNALELPLRALFPDDDFPLARQEDT